MALRRIFSRWLWPAAAVLPLWLLLGWAVFGASGWAFLWVLFIAMPSVALTQVVLTLLVRARPSFRQTRAVSWIDVAGFGVWHALTIAVGLFSARWFGLLLTLAIAAAIALFWIQLWQLWREAASRVGRVSFAEAEGILRGEQSGFPGARTRQGTGTPVIVVEEGQQPRA
ncbi:MFS transporter permease [Microbacterium album]|uniref:MFS transporter permease n=1 Tax=Microbacterium album TaxID=2053191 RepID=A0A917ICP3_9MICO|nr:MFS transporter permease [Microbacterium album]GGH39449.1 hypothetical protein GCM10010921_10660 [Microbacterium album]